MSIIRRFVKLCLLFLAIAIILAFIFGNQHSVLFSLPPTSLETELPLFILLSIFFICGVIVALLQASLYYGLKQRGLKKQLKQASKEKQAVSTELTSLRAERKADTHIALHSA